MAPHLRLIVNPQSGGGRSRRLMPALAARLRDGGCEFSSYFTKSAEHASQLASEAASEGHWAVAVGGDGLVNAVANGAIASGLEQPVIAVVPGGRGNDFARWLGIAGPEQAARALVAGSTNAIDTGLIEGRHFLCIASLGFDSDVLVNAENIRLIKGRPVYAYALIKSLLKWKPASFQLELDGVERQFDGYNVVAANTGCYGGGMRVAPHAEADDGKLDVVTIANTSRARFLAHAPKVLKGTHLGVEVVDCQKVEKLRVSADRPFAVFADGEHFGQSPVEITVARKSVRVVVPPA